MILRLSRLCHLDEPPTFQNVRQELAARQRQDRMHRRATAAQEAAVRDEERRAAADVTERRRQHREGDREQARQLREAVVALKA